MQIHMAIRTCIRNLKVGRGVKNGSFRNMIGNNICNDNAVKIQNPTRHVKAIRFF